MLFTIVMFVVLTNDCANGVCELERRSKAVDTAEKRPLRGSVRIVESARVRRPVLRSNRVIGFVTAKTDWTGDLRAHVESHHRVSTKGLTAQQVCDLHDSFHQ